MHTSFIRFISHLVIISMLGLSLPMQSAQAGIVRTDQAMPSAQAQQERNRIRTFLERADVRSELQKRGLNADEAKARVNALTDEEAHKVAGRLDKLPAGGDIIGILFTVFIVLLVTDILGFTKVFSFTRPIK